MLTGDEYREHNAQRLKKWRETNPDGYKRNRFNASVNNVLRYAANEHGDIEGVKVIGRPGAFEVIPIRTEDR